MRPTVGSAWCWAAVLASPLEPRGFDVGPSSRPAATLFGGPALGAEVLLNLSVASLFLWFVVFWGVLPLAVLRGLVTSHRLS